MKEISISDRNRCSNWFMKFMGLERLKALIKRSNSYISRTFWQELEFICIYPSTLPINIPCFFFFVFVFSIYTQTCKKAIKSFKDLKLKLKHLQDLCFLNSVSGERQSPSIPCLYAKDGKDMDLLLIGGGDGHAVGWREVRLLNS